MALSGKPPRIVVVEATSLLGKELAEAIHTPYPTANLKLLDEDVASGILTDLAGEPSVVQSVDSDSFDGANLVFFAGKPQFAAAHADAAIRSGATVIDLSGGMRDRADARVSIPSLDETNDAVPSMKGAIISPSAPVIVAAGLAAALAQWKPSSMSIVFLQPVSERGQEGIEELERQTVNLLSFQPIGDSRFGTQVAFNVMDRYGSGATESLEKVRSAIGRDVASYLGKRANAPAIQVLQAPIFHTHCFSAFAAMNGAPTVDVMEKALIGAGFEIHEGDADAPSAITAAGADRAILSRPLADPNSANGFWFWGAADNLRVSVVNAMAIAHRALES
jgi:aspartate-semialdehyde dehydrogenase